MPVDHTTNSRSLPAIEAADDEAPISCAPAAVRHLTTAPSAHPVLFQSPCTAVSTAEAACPHASQLASSCSTAGGVSVQSYGHMGTTQGS